MGRGQTGRGKGEGEMLKGVMGRGRRKEQEEQRFHRWI